VKTNFQTTPAPAKRNKPTTEGDYTLYEWSVVAKNNKKNLPNVYRDWGWEGWGVNGPMWGFVVIGVVRRVGVVADGGHERCFVVVGDDWVGDLWWLGEFVRREEWAA
jgi:hypothetical protein